MVDTIVAFLQTYLINEDDVDPAILNLVAERAIAKFKSFVGYPSNMSDEDIQADLESNINCIEDLALFAWVKQGGEFESQHSENNTNRSYFSEAQIFATWGIVPYVRI